jgi:cytoskeletal protein CcmA (bactofilin family)
LVVGAVSPQSPSVSSNSGTIQVGSPLNWSDTGIVGTFQANTNSYVQLVVQNSNTGTLSSADLIVSNDTSGTAVYGDFGINSTTSNNPSDPFGDPNGTYLYSSGGSLAQGTLSAFDYDIVTNNTIRLTANGTTGNIAIANNLSVSGNITAPSAIINGLNVYSYITSAYAQANVTAGGLVTANANIAAAFTTANNAVANLCPVITVNSAGYLFVANTKASISNTTGALVISGGLGVAGNIYTTGVITVNNSVTIANTQTTNSASMVYNATLNSIDFIFN